MPRPPHASSLPHLPVGPTPSCCAYVVHEGRLLLIQRGTEPDKGLWEFPGGRIELGETVFQAVKREVREETGVDVEPLEVVQVHDWIYRDDTGGVRFHYVTNYVWSRYLSGGPRAGDDAIQAMWVTEAEVRRLCMHPFVRRAGLRLLQEKL